MAVPWGLCRPSPGAGVCFLVMLWASRVGVLVLEGHQLEGHLGTSLGAWFGCWVPGAPHSPRPAAPAWMGECVCLRVHRGHTAGKTQGGCGTSHACAALSSDASPCAACPLHTSPFLPTCFLPGEKGFAGAVRLRVSRATFPGCPCLSEMQSRRSRDGGGGKVRGDHG